MYFTLNRVCEPGLRANPSILHGEMVNLQYQPVLASPMAAVAAQVVVPMKPDSSSGGIQQWLQQHLQWTLQQ